MSEFNNEEETELKKILEEINKSKQDALYYNVSGQTPPDEYYKKISGLIMDVLRINVTKMPTDALKQIIDEIESKEFIRNSYAKMGIPVDDPMYVERIKMMDERILNGEEYRIFMAEYLTRSFI